jgi:hypothetical protein
MYSDNTTNTPAAPKVDKLIKELCNDIALLIRHQTKHGIHGGLPSGHLYAQLMGVMTHERYEELISTFISEGLIRRTPGHLLVWIKEEEDTK